MIANKEDYLKLPWVIFTCQEESSIFSLEDLFGKTIAIEKGYVLQKRLAKEFPQIKQLLADDTADALAAVSENRADAFVGNLTIAQFHITTWVLPISRLPLPPVLAVIIWVLPCVLTGLC